MQKQVPPYQNVLVLYHEDCFDGKMSAWAVYEALTRSSGKQVREDGDTVYYIGGQIHFKSIRYDDPLPDFTDKDVFMVDFSAEIEDLVNASRMAKSVTVIDHHATIRDKVTAYQKLHPKTTLYREQYNAKGLLECFEWRNDDKVSIYFNNQNSGALLTWKYFNLPVPAMYSIHGEDDAKAPSLLQYAQDYDLFRWKVKGSREVATAIYDQLNDTSFAGLQELVNMFQDQDPTKPIQAEGGVRDLYENGVVIFKHQNTLARGIIKRGMKMETIKFGDQVLYVPVCQAPRELRTMVAELLAEKHIMSIAYEDYPSKNAREYSFRSNKEVEGWINVKEFAETFGGGGHDHAAGVVVEYHRSAVRVLGE